MKLPAPTMRMRRETMKAAAQEKAIPLWAERRSLKLATIIKIQNIYLKGNNITDRKKNSKGIDIDIDKEI